MFRRAVAPLDLAVDMEALAVGAGQVFVAVPSLGDPHPVPLQSRVLLVEVMEVRLCVGLGQDAERLTALLRPVVVDAARETNTRPAPEKSRLTLLDSASPDRAGRA